jgi:preprotein translocase subunit SecD
LKRDRKLILSIVVVVTLALVSLLGFFLGNTPVLGLDLRGGIEVVLQAPSGTPASVMNQALESIRRRVDALGVAEPNLSVVGNTIQVQLPGAAGGSVKQEPTNLYCLIGAGGLSYGCFKTEASANAAQKAMKVETQVTQSCLVDTKGNTIACYLSTADAQAALGSLYVQGATASKSIVPTPPPSPKPSPSPSPSPKSRPSPSASPSLAKAKQSAKKTPTPTPTPATARPAASPSANAITQYCVTGTSGQVYNCYPTKAQAQAEIAGTKVDTTSQYCLSRTPQGSSACYTTQTEANSALAAIKVQHVTTQYCVYDSGGTQLGCYPSQTEASDELNSIGQSHILELLSTTARLEQRPVLYDSAGSPEIYGKSSQQWNTTAVTCPNSLAQQTTACSPEVLSKQDVVFPSKDGNLKYALGPVALTGASIKKATAVFQQASQTNAGAASGWVVDFTLTPQGSADFARVTQDMVGKQLAIVLDNQVISAPVVQSAITGGSGQITGNFTEQQAKDLATTLNAGALPVNLKRQAVQTVSATLGKESLKQGLIAGLVGLVLLMIYLAFYYRVLGIVTWFGMTIWACLALGIVGLMGQHAGYALTLAGVAGLVVSLGITADSYIVFYERLKDEVRGGKSPRSAIQPAFRKAWRTIVAADIVTVLAAAVLYVVAISSVRGFALTLGVCTFLDMFVVYFFKRPTVFLMARSDRLVNMHGFGMVSGVAAEESAEAELA